MLSAIAVAQLSANLQAFATASFMLHRSATSYRQLEAYQQTSIDLLEFMRAARNASASQALTEGRRSTLADLTTLDRLSAFETRLVAANGGLEQGSKEADRLLRIQGSIRKLLASAPSSMEPIYENDLKPLIVEAVRGEQGEVEDVESAMRDLQTRMRVSGPLGVCVQIVTFGVVLALIGRLVLDPLSRLVADIRALGRGSLAHRVEVKRHDEFGLLSQHINRMARSLERGHFALIESNERLETTVAERTMALSERNTELKEIDESRRRFFADVSHELRTPMTAIVGEAQVTLRIADTSIAPYRDALVSILANSTYLNRRIDDLMALARSSHGRLELESRSIDLNLVAASATTEIGSLARINGMRIVFAPAETELTIHGDQTRMRQCLMVLLDNAVKFSRSGGAIVVTLVRDGDDAVVSVTDEGRGIAVEDLPRVFDRFYQTEVGKRAGGTGLGLAIARSIVEAHGGRIAATTAETGGTRMILTIPLALEVSA